MSWMNYQIEALREQGIFRVTEQDGPSAPAGGVVIDSMAPPLWVDFEDKDERDAVLELIEAIS